MNQLHQLHLVHYLPYDLKCQVIVGGEQHIEQLHGIYNGKAMIGGSKIDVMAFELSKVKPVLRPLRFIIPYIGLSLFTLSDKSLVQFRFNEDSSKANCTDYFIFKDAQKLAAFHIELFDLIAQGLAIDNSNPVVTLPTQSY